MTIQEVKKMLEGIEGEAYIVGGTLRDIKLNRGWEDIDIVASDPHKVAKYLSGKWGSKAVKIGNNKETCYRIPLKDYYNKRWVDITSIAGNNIYEDLALRDFTINAMAVKISDDSIGGNNIIDPFGGMKDLEKGLLNMVNKNIFRKDALRLWRLWRFSAQLNFKPSTDTLKEGGKDAHLCHSLPGERVYREIKQLLLCKDGGKFLVKSSKYGLIEHQFPELNPMKGSTQNEYHHLDVWDHTMMVILCLEGVLNNLDKWFNENQISAMSHWLDNKDRKAVLKLSALFHDVAKPKTRSVGKDGRVHFYGHEKAGLPIVDKTSDRLRMPLDDKKLILLLVKEHLRIRDIVTKASYSNKIKFWKEYKEDAFGIILLFYGDLMGKEGPLTTREKVEGMRKTIRKDFLEIWFKDLKDKLDTPPLLSGDELKSLLGIESSPLVGRIKEEIHIAHLEGKIKTKDEAKILATEMLIEEKM